MGSSKRISRKLPLDILGAGLLGNAIAWDVHVARHTRCAQHEAKLDRRGQRNKTVTW